MVIRDIQLAAFQKSLNLKKKNWQPNVQRHLQKRSFDQHFSHITNSCAFSVTSSTISHFPFPTPKLCQSKLQSLLFCLDPRSLHAKMTLNQKSLPAI